MMRNMAGMMKKVQNFQTQLESFQSEFEDQQFSASVANNAVTATVSGSGALNALKINPKIINAAEPKMLEDMICAATKKAQTAANDEKNRLMKDITSGLPWPANMGLPF